MAKLKDDLYISNNLVWHKGNLANGTTAQYIRGDGSLATYTDTTYSVLSAAEASTGTATTARTISAKVLADEINRRSDLRYLPLSGGTLTGTLTSPKILINKSGNAASGISWYNSTFTAWQDYMASSGTTGNGVNANITAPSGTLVTAWARRSFIESVAGYGWTFESGTSSSTTPSVVAEIRSSDGAAKFGGSVTAPSFIGNINASSLNTGTVPDARITGTYTGLTNLTGTGNVDFARFIGNAGDTVAAPSITWTGDLNTGIYRPAAAQVAITTGGVQRALFSSAGITGTLVGNASSATCLLPNYIGGLKPNPQTYFGNTIGLKVAMTGQAGSWSDTLWINGYAGADVPNMVAIHTSRQATPRMWLSSQNNTGTTYGTLYEVISSYNIANQNVANASTATKLQTARTIAGVSFDGTANIAIPFANLSSKPTTLGGYDITDGVQINSANWANFRYTAITEANKDVVENVSGSLKLDGWYSLNVGAAYTHGTRLTIAGLNAHDKTQLYFNGGNGSIQYRKSWYSNNPWTSLRTILDSDNSSVSGNTIKINGTSTTWVNTHRGIQDNLTSTSTVDSLSAAQGRLLANGSARDSTKLALSGGTMTGNTVVSNYGIGNVGLYSASRYQNVFSMGTAYVPSADGTSLGSMYGIAWTHPNVGGQSKAGLSHQALFVEAGVTKTAIGTGIWTSGNVTASGFIGNASTATTLATARTIGISGGVTGTPTSFNGSANISIPITAMDASKLTTGTLPDARLGGVYTGFTHRIDGANTIFTTPSSGTQNSLGRTVFGLAEFRSATSATIGAIIFIAPFAKATAIMKSIEIDGMLYSPSNAVRVVINNYTSGLTRKMSYGTVDIQVRVGETADGKFCVILGDVATTWSYPHLTISKAMFSHGSTADTICYGWTTALVTSLTGYINISAELANAPIITNITGNATTATTATALATNAGSATQPVYFSGGKPVAATAYASASVNYATSAGTATSASSATNATNTTNINTLADDSSNAARFILFSDAATGNQRAKTDTGLKYNPSSNTITATLAGNASSATNLQTSRTIWGQSFDGSANVSGILSGVSNITMTGTIGNTTGTNKLDLNAYDTLRHITSSATETIMTSGAYRSGSSHDLMVSVIWSGVVTINSGSVSITKNYGTMNITGTRVGVGAATISFSESYYFKDYIIIANGGFAGTTSSAYVSIPAQYKTNTGFRMSIGDDSTPNDGTTADITILRLRSVL